MSFIFNTRVISCQVIDKLLYLYSLNLESYGEIVYIKMKFILHTLFHFISLTPYVLMFTLGNLLCLRHVHRVLSRSQFLIIHIIFCLR